MVVISIKELYLLKGLGAGGVTKDGGVHNQEQVQSRGSWKDSRGSEINEVKAQFPTICVAKWLINSTAVTQTDTQKLSLD